MNNKFMKTNILKKKTDENFFICPTCFFDFLLFIFSIVFIFIFSHSFI